MKVGSRPMATANATWDIELGPPSRAFLRRLPIMPESLGVDALCVKWAERMDRSSTPVHTRLGARHSSGMAIDFSELGERLRTARHARGVSQEAAAHAIGVSTSAVTRLERKASDKTTVGTVAALAALYRTSLDWLLLGRREPDYPGWHDFIEEQASWPEPEQITDWERDVLGSIEFPGEWLPTSDAYHQMLSGLRVARVRDEARRREPAIQAYGK